VRRNLTTRQACPICRVPQTYKMAEVHSLVCALVPLPSSFFHPPFFYPSFFYSLGPVPTHSLCFSKLCLLPSSVLSLSVPWLFQSLAPRSQNASSPDRSLPCLIMIPNRRILQ